MTLFYFILSIGILVFVHEYGHYWVARRCRVGVQRFSIGMGPVIWRRASPVSGVEWVISAIPLGGYVMFIPDPEKNAVAEKSDQWVGAQLQYQNFLRSGEQYFTSAKPFQKIIIALAGPVFNLVFAWFVFAGLAKINGETITHQKIATPVAGSIAAQLGISRHDSLKAIEWQEGLAKHKAEFENWNAFREWQRNKGHITDGVILWVERLKSPNQSTLVSIPIAADILRQRKEESLENYLGLYPLSNGMKIVKIDSKGAVARSKLQVGDTILFVRTAQGEVPIESVPQLKTYLPLDGEVELGVLKKGVEVSGSQGAANQSVVWEKVEVEKRQLGVALELVGAQTKRPFGVYESMTKGWQQLTSMLTTGVHMVIKVVQLDVDKATLGGPITIAMESKRAADYGIEGFVFFLGMLSVSLGFMNLLPIPLLDGGQIIMHALEWIKGGALNQRFVDYASKIGLALILLMMVVAIFNDFQMIDK